MIDTLFRNVFIQFKYSFQVLHFAAVSYLRSISVAKEI